MATACVPHAVMFPHPVQGHINPMIHLAGLLVSQGFFITFVHTSHNFKRTLVNPSSKALLSIPNLQFVHLSDGLPPHHGRINEDLVEFITAIDNFQHGPFDRLMESILSDPKSPPVTCIIADSYLCWMQDVANRFNVPRISFWTTPAHANLTYLYQSLLISQGFIPFKDVDPDLVVTSIPGVVPLRVSDLSAVFEEDNFVFRFVLNSCMKRSPEALWNIGNNLYELEHEAIDRFTENVSSFLPIGPLLPADFFSSTSTKTSSGMSLWQEDDRCEHWLNNQKAGSVLYISFGSVAQLSKNQLEELRKGLKASQQTFLWALRPDSTLDNFQESFTNQGLVIPWAPQLQVLSHPSVGAFLTHCGWNSIMESISAGVPLLAWPGRFAEQKMNGRYVVDEWKIGMEFKTNRKDKLVESNEVERVIKLMMQQGNSEAEVIKKMVEELRDKARQAVTEAGGSSRANLQRFVDDMRNRQEHKITGQVSG